MALDPSLITDVMSRWQGPQLPDPIERAAKLQALRSGVLQQQAAQQNLQTGALELQQKQQALQDQQQMDAAWKGAVTTDPNTGAVNYDRAKVLSNVPGHLAPGISKTFTDMDESAAKAAKAKADAVTATNDLAGFALSGVKDHAYDPAFLNATLKHGVGTGALTAQQAAQMWQQVGGDNATPATVQPVVDQFLSTPGVQEAINKRTTAKAAETSAEARTKTAATGAEKEQAELPGIKADTAQKVRAGDATALESAFTQGGPDAFNAALGALRQQDPARADVFAGVKNVQDIRNLGMTPEQRTTAGQAAATAAETKRYHDVELENAASHLGIERDRLYQDKEETKLTPEARDKMAEMFATTGQLPSMGMGKSAGAVRSQIMNRASELYPQVQFATNQAAFQANKQSLKQAQTRMDQVTAAENTAGKNLDVFLDTAKKVVDTGSPWINQPLRAVAAGGLGASDMAAYNAARQTAVAEIGKVLNNPQGGAAVSDSARKEVEGLLSPNATLKQVYAAANILRTDMKNRHDAYQGQIDAITNRIGTGGPGAPPPVSAPAAPKNPFRD